MNCLKLKYIFLSIALIFGAIINFESWKQFNKRSITGKSFQWNITTENFLEKRRTKLKKKK